MPIRKQLLVNNEAYHVFNRGVASLPIFNSSFDYKRFLSLIDFYSYKDNDLSFSAFLDLAIKDRKTYLQKFRRESPRLVKFLAYCLMPNHYHFLLIQLENEGIRKVFSKAQNAYVRYFNLRNDRVGPLFQSRFKALRIESDEILCHISRYIHLNPSTSFLVTLENLSGYQWSSYPDYLGTRRSNIVEIDTDFILKFFNRKRRLYDKFVLDQAEYQKSLAYLKRILPK